MKKLWITLFALLAPIAAAHLVLAAGYFKVGEKAPSFTLTAITGETVGLDTYKRSSGERVENTPNPHETYGVRFLIPGNSMSFCHSL